MHSGPISRRCFCAAVSGSLALASAGRCAAPPRSTFTLGFSTYGMAKLRTEDALAVLGRVGYDSVELCALPDRDSAPDKLPPARRKTLKKVLADRGLKLTALMDQLTPSSDGKTDKGTRDRLAKSVELARDLGAPLIETVLGGGAW